jgi:hypothetical protein
MPERARPRRTRKVRRRQPRSRQQKSLPAVLWEAAQNHPFVTLSLLFFAGTAIATATTRPDAQKIVAMAEPLLPPPQTRRRWADDIAELRDVFAEQIGRLRRAMASYVPG